MLVPCGSIAEGGGLAARALMSGNAAAVPQFAARQKIVPNGNGAERSRISGRFGQRRRRRRLRRHCRNLALMFGHLQGIG
jgi:hypothetical protein